MASLLAVVFSCVLLAASVSSLPPSVFNVGDERGWTVPSGNGTETYNHWAKRNRFQVGDVLDFKYANDSVLLVNHDDYKQCSTDSPLSRFTDGDTKFTFDRYGLFYFVSGVPGHCEAGQRMIARVKAPSALTGAPAAAPGMPPSVGGSIGGGASSPVSSPGGVPPGSSSTTTSTPSPSSLPQASGASRCILSVVSSIVVGLVVVGVVTLFVLV
ncbi:early nodulin-like protein 21 [Phragmites australis]|uniref:early nodulin-like protein 21 n=1 Tax=Phragmites australis TaxID=29695 RepID=UPI002D77A6F5|nr:early nodulin-like protein 21 [Phragmites australis]